MLRINDLVGSQKFEKSEYIRLLYDVLFQRDTDTVALEKLMERSDVENFFSEFLSSPEFRMKSLSSSYIPGLQLNGSARPRILLFGAYGNGNLGDKIQAESLLRGIRHIRPDVEVWACSVLRGAFPFPFDRVLPADAFAKPRIVNQFDMLMIGGGGLLAHPHDPLTNPEWQSGINIPIAFVGVGAAPGVVARSETLVKKAVYVSVRDEHSMSAMQRIVPEPKFLPDPVLCDSEYDARAAVRSGRWQAGNRRLWILKHGAPDQLAQCRRLIDPETDEICFLEPHLDFPLISAFPLAKPMYRADELIALIDNADMVISMRYHGCILAMLRDRPTIAIREHKCLELFHRYGNDRYFVRDAADLSFDLAGYRAPDELLMRDRARFVSELSNVLAAVKTREPAGKAPAAGAIA
jgi:hypothetical protein